MAKLLYQGHGSFRLISKQNIVIYVDPYIGEGYDLLADIILVTHQHFDHNQTEIVAKKADCKIITNKEALANGIYNQFKLKGIEIISVKAANKNHSPEECVGYIIILDNIKVYALGDTSKTDTMHELADLHIDYALLPGDGIYNMDLEEMALCAKLIGAKHNIPYHLKPKALYSLERAQEAKLVNKLLVLPGEEIILT